MMSHQPTQKSTPTIYILAGVVIVFLVLMATAKQAPAATDFVQKAAIGNQFEISSSRLAFDHAQNADVKSFAQNMIDDHTKIGAQLKAVLANSKASMPIPNPSLDLDHQKQLDALNGLKGADFDKKYIDEQVKAHDETVDLFSRYAKNGENADLKNFAAQVLPTLREHQLHARQLASAE